MSWYDYTTLAERNPDLITDDSARVCFDVYTRHELPTEAPFRIPLVQEQLPRVLTQRLGTVVREDIGLPSKLPIEPKGTVHKRMQIRWNRCPTASMTYSGWIDVHGHDADVFLFTTEADLDAYREALTVASVLSDNSGDSCKFTVKVFAPDMYNEWEPIYKVEVCSGILRPLRLKGQTMWNVTANNQFISFDGKHGGWYSL